MQLVALNVHNEVRIHKYGCSDTTKLVKKGRLNESDLVPFEAADKTEALTQVWGDELSTSEDPEVSWYIYADKTKFSACGVAHGPDKLSDGGGYAAYIESLIAVEPEPASAGTWTLLTESETATVNADPEAVAAIADAQDAADELSAAQHQDEVTHAHGQHTFHTHDAEDYATHQQPIDNEVQSASGMLTVTAWDADGNQLLFPASSVLSGNGNNESRFNEVSFSTESQLNTFLARNHTTAWTKDGERTKIDVLNVVRASDPDNAVVVVPGTRHGANA